MEFESRFMEWYAIAVPGFAPQQAKARLESIREMRDIVSKKNLADFVRLFFSLPTSTQFVEYLRTRLKQKDEGYVSHDQAELGVIAAGLLYSLLEAPSDIGSAIALAVFCVEAAGSRKQPRVDDVVIRSRDYLAREGVAVRESDSTNISFPADNLLETAAGENEDEEQNDFSRKEAISILNALKASFDSIGNKISAIERRHREESDILYWLMGESTLDRHEHFSGFTTAEACLLAAFDLAKLTQDIPGPIGSRAFLNRMLRLPSNNDASKLSVADLVAGLQPERRKEVLAKYVVNDPVLTPLLFALSKSEESGGGQAWAAAFKNMTDLDPKKRLAALDLTELFYSELLLSKAISN